MYKLVRSLCIPEHIGRVLGVRSVALIFHNIFYIIICVLSYIVYIHLACKTTLCLHSFVCTLVKHCNLSVLGLMY